MPNDRPPPITLSPTSPPPSPSQAAAFIFIHGLGDTAEGIESIANQFRAAKKLPHLTWLLPTALANHDLATTAWYMPTRLSPYPPSRPELEDDEDEEGMMESVRYVVGLIDELVEQGVPVGRVVVGGFSQGHAIALLVGLVSKYAGRIAGVVGLSGYLPLVPRIPELRVENGLEKDVGDIGEVFLARGTGDRLVPKRYHRLCCEALEEFGVNKEKMEVREYEGMGHSMGAAELRDLCAWLERVVPELE